MHLWQEGSTIPRRVAREVDERAVREYGMTSLVLMENAGRGCADVLCNLGISGPVVICCGRGNNAGDGFVLARHLDLRGYDARVLLCSEPSALRGDAAENFRILTRADVPITLYQDEPEEFLRQQWRGADWLVDALLGTGSQGGPRPPLDRIVMAMNAHPARKLAVDLPSGLDCDKGEPAEPTFRADHTCTFVAAKQGFVRESARPWLGQVHVLDIGVPRKLIQSLITPGPARSVEDPH
jgi:NAD(P)H-hydrate epimerase